MGMARLRSAQNCEAIWEEQEDVLRVFNECVAGEEDSVGDNGLAKEVCL